MVGRNNYVVSTLCGIVISTKTWAKLSQEQKNAMTGAGREIEKKFHEEVQQEDERAADSGWQNDIPSLGNLQPN